jgi:dihydroorotase
MSGNPRKRFGITTDPGYTVWDLNAEYAIDPKDFLSKGRATPFEGAKVSGRCLKTVYNNETVWKYEE